MWYSYTDKVDFKSRGITRDWEKYFIIIKGSIQCEDITILILYALTGKPQYIKKNNYRAKIRNRNLYNHNLKTTVNIVYNKEIKN